MKTLDDMNSWKSYIMSRIRRNYECPLLRSKRGHMEFTRPFKICVGVGIILFILVNTFFINGKSTAFTISSPGPSIHQDTQQGWVKPNNLTVVALVFYGRRSNVQILERYLRVCHSIYSLMMRKIWLIMVGYWIEFISFPK